MPSTELDGPDLLFKSVTFRYGSKVALEDLSLTVPMGTTGLLGINGAGKSTAMRLAIGELRPGTGTVTSHGQSGRDARIGYCPQSVSLPKNIRVVEFLDYLAWLRKVPRARRAESLNETMEWAGLQQHRRDKVGSLSGGMLRRLVLAQSLLGSPDILLLDEPTTGLDPEQRVRVRELLKQLPAKLSVLLSSHIVEDIALLADKTAILHDGRILREISKAEAEQSETSLEDMFLRSISQAA